MNAVERILCFTQIEPEAPLHTDAYIPDTWPEKGQLEIKNLEVKYGDKITLQDINCIIPSRSKVGIVGRTGAGKSTLAASLFRLVEASKGSIVIDGVDISTIGLSELRSRLAIIPQDPFLFRGTIRSNLDPAKEYTDEEIWEALSGSNLKSFVVELPDQLNTKVDSGGTQFSLGQRQLVCLARAIIKKPTIIVLDEATASLDFVTDQIIQTSVRRDFKNATVLTIAHRLSTIQDSDYVMVLDQGKLQEFDHPQTLLQDPSTIFSHLVTSHHNHNH